MSMHPYVNMGYGYEIDITDDDIFNNLVKLFPEVASENQNGEGEIDDFRAFLHGVSDSFWKKYRELDFVIVFDDNVAPTYLIVDRESQCDLYDKYGSNESGVIRPSNLYYDTTEALAQIAHELGINDDPEILIWTYWS